MNNYGPLNPKIPDSNIINLSNLRLRYSLIKLFRELKNFEDPLKASFNSLDVYESISNKGKAKHKLIKKFKF